MAEEKAMESFDKAIKQLTVIGGVLSSDEAVGAAQVWALIGVGHAILSVAEALQEPEVGIDPGHMRKVVENSKDHSCRVGQHQSCTSNWCHCYCHNPEGRTHV